MSSLIPIGLVLVVERRTCLTCGATYDCPSSQLSELAVSPVGTPYQKTIVNFPDRKEDPSPNRALHLVQVEIPHCQLCWQTTIDWADLEGIRPPPRINQPLPREDIRSFLARIEREAQERKEAELAAKGKKKVRALTLDEL